MHRSQLANSRQSRSRKWRGEVSQGGACYGEIGKVLGKTAEARLETLQLGEAGEGGGFVVEAGDNVAEMERVEDEEDVAVGAEEAEVAASGAERSEGANDGAEAGAVELDNVFEIEDDAASAGVDEISKLGAQIVVGAADGDFALEVQNGDFAGLTNGDLQAQGAPSD